jgi:hypothetical protein
MTQDEIIELACQTFGGVIKKEERDNFIAFAKLVAKKAYLDGLENGIKAEREACAKICDDELKQWGIFDSDVGDVSKAIRARGQT